ncbi:MAG: rRNA pseudouridine synthase [candidate division Zixibacteria bacterium]|nr:rRNA pseudouridine synthase [candidate division Zixibacteria bacterium]
MTDNDTPNSAPTDPAPPRGERLNRFLSRAGVGSRRRADELIACGRVAINGVMVEKLATFVDPDRDRVAVDGKPVIAPSDEPVWIIMNKTAGLLTTRRDVRGRNTIFSILPEEYSKLIPVGRLDMDTEGVLLLTNDGETANRLMHPRYEVERVYEAVVEGTPTREEFQRLRAGIDLGDPTPAKAKAKIVTMHRTGAVVQVSLHEGRKREVKRLFEAIGHKVLRLRRLSYAGITAREVRPGQWRKLNEREIARLTSTEAKSE